MKLLDKEGLRKLSRLHCSSAKLRIDCATSSAEEPFEGLLPRHKEFCHDVVREGFQQSVYRNFTYADYDAMAPETSSA